MSLSAIKALLKFGSTPKPNTPTIKRVKITSTAYFDTYTEETAEALQKKMADKVEYVDMNICLKRPNNIPEFQKGEVRVELEEEK